MTDAENNNPSIREHLANERTFLAWMRTSIGIMAFGFVVVKFALFVRQISLMLGKEYLIHSTGFSGAVGIILVCVGTVTSILSYIKYKKTEKQLRAGRYEYSSLLSTLLIIFIFLISLFLIVYLIKST
jgi:putative membrane protein